MYNYNGINTDSLMLLAQNRFENNRNFYEENKEKLKNGILIPMKQIAQELSEDMYGYDENMMLDPSKMISRIRRDTRYTKDKSLYRENCWMMFMRPKKVNPYVPCFWFELSPNGYSYGVGTYEVKPRLMELYRNRIEQYPAIFREAVTACEKAGGVFYGDYYKKEKETTLPDDFKKYYSVKSLYFLKTSNNIDDLNSDGVISEGKEIYKQFYPLYKFLLDISLEFENEGSDLNVR